jgi:SAM-dependent methyltransferase
MGTYVFDQGWAQENRRLGTLSQLYDEGTTRHLNDLGVRPGWRCWEVGAGSGTIATWLAERVGGEGTVLATDVDTRFLGALATVNVEVRGHDVTSEPIEAEAFDLIHTRALLEHLPDRVKALGNMVSALRPGGWLLVEDGVLPPSACHPNLPVLDKIVQALALAFRSVGADPDYGVKLPAALSDAGLVDIGYQARVPIMTSGTPSADFIILTIEQLRERLIAAGLLTTEEAEEALAAAQEPGGIAFAPIMVAAWGRRPTD